MSVSRPTTIAAAIAASLMILTPVAASARAEGGYVAVPAAQSATTSFIAGSTPFVWRDNAYVSPRTGSERANIMCELIVKKVGKLSSFTADGAALDADTLAKCNARAK